MKTTTINKTPELMEDLAVVQDFLGSKEISQAIRYAVRREKERIIATNGYAFTQPQPQQPVPQPKNKPGRKKKTLEDKIKEEEEKQKIKEKRGYDVCKQLDGEVVEQDNGHKGCQFKNYEKVGNRVLEGKTIVPLPNLTPSYIEKQYRGGTKKEICKILNNTNSKK
jgi:hypothetical protein